MILFSGENVHCNNCGTIMTKLGDDYIVCEQCGNDGWLDERDPEIPDRPLQSCPLGEDYTPVYRD